MSLTFNGAQVKKVTLNGDEVKRINHNDTEVWTGVSPILNENSWETISEVARAGKGADYWNIGDVKMIELNGKIGDYCTTDHLQLGVFILDFNHSENGVSDNNIIFGGFKKEFYNKMYDVALSDNSDIDCTFPYIKNFSMNHRAGKVDGAIQKRNTGSNFGGWKGSDLRFDILGSTSIPPSDYSTQWKTASNIGYDATLETLANPKEDTLLAAIPNEFRRVLRLRTHYVDNKGGSTAAPDNVSTVIDAVSLLSTPEVFGNSDVGWYNRAELNYQSQMQYYAEGNKKNKMFLSTDGKTSWSNVFWWLCSPSMSYDRDFCVVNNNGGETYSDSCYRCSLAPIFKV